MVENFDRNDELDVKSNVHFLQIASAERPVRWQLPRTSWWFTKMVSAQIRRIKTAAFLASLFGIICGIRKHER